MARTPRLHFPGAVYHVILRGNDKQRIFVSDADRYKFEELIANGVDRYGHSIHAYCWMENHIHMTVQVAQVPLSKVMHNLSFRYTRYFNWRHKHVGHLFQGRYKALLIDADSYLLTLMRYIHRNPVRAGIAENAGDYAWSSHRDYIGLTTTSWLHTDWILAHFADDPNTAIERYIQFMEAEPDMQSPPDFKRERGGKAIVGDAKFIRQTLSAARPMRERRHDQLLSICAAVCLAAGISDEALRSGSRIRAISNARCAVAFLVQLRRQGSLTALAQHLRRDVSTLCRMIQRILQEKRGSAIRLLIARAEAILKNARMQA